jgi:hypothetical protein
MLVTPYELERVEAVGSADGSMGEVEACGHHVAKGEAGAEVDNHTYTVCLREGLEVDGAALAVVAAAEGVDMLQRPVSVGTVGEQEDGGHMGVAHGVTR